MIRLATFKDISQIVDIHIKTWYETYTGMIKQDILDELSIGSGEKLWKAVLEDQNHAVWVYEHDGKILGFADFYYSSKLKNGEIKAIYLLKSIQKQGIGRQLLKFGFERFRQQGYQVVDVDVLNKNSSRYFYEKLGAVLIARKSVEEDGVGLESLTYRWILKSI